MAITAREMVYSVRMSGRPEFYSGRPARHYDLSGKQLFGIYTKIKEELGEEQATAFVTMVEKIGSLSATNFLNTLYALEANEWVYDDKLSINDSDIDVGPDNPSRNAIAFATIASAISGGGHDETEYIRNTFFQMINHHPKAERKGFDYGTDFRW